MIRRTLEMNRRAFLVTSAGTVLASCVAGDDPSDPWSREELIEPSDLAAVLSGRRQLPRVYYVGFPVLYRQRHIRGAILAGPDSKTEGLNGLRMAVRGLPKKAAIVIYCGCCPMKDCPNIRPAHRMLKEAGFNNVRVLNLPKNFQTDWVLKGYPVG